MNSSAAYEVIVVGGGNAAICAAIGAAEKGGHVLLLEAAPQYSGSAIEITEGGRAVGSVPFAVETGQRQKKFG